MARIVVQGKSNPLMPATTIAECLEVTLQYSAVRAGLANSHTIPVSMSIARDVLGAKHVPCAYNGTRPASFFEQGSYRAFSINSSTDGIYNESITGEHCADCGYAVSYSSHETSKLLQGHPERMRLVADKLQGTITTAAWDTAAECLVPSSDNKQTLIIWRKGWTLTRDRAQQLALKNNPGALVVADIHSYIILLHG